MTRLQPPAATAVIGAASAISVLIDGPSNLLVLAGPAQHDAFVFATSGVTSVTMLWEAAYEGMLGSFFKPPPTIEKRKWAFRSKPTRIVCLTRVDVARV